MKNQINYEEHKKQIQIIVAIWKRKTKIDFEEMLAEANLTFCEAKETYQSKKININFETYLGRKLKDRMWTLIQEHIRHAKEKDPHKLASYMISKYSTDPQKAVETQQLIDNNPILKWAIKQGKTRSIKKVRQMIKNKIGIDEFRRLKTLISQT